MGFRDRAGFEAFSGELNTQIRAVDPNAELVLQGSSLPGRRFERSVDMRFTGEQFDVGRISDYDVAIVSPTLHARAVDARIPLGESPLTPAQLRTLGLGELHDAAQAASRARTGILHEVHFKIFPGHPIPSRARSLGLDLDLPLP
jgi:filamentous hemagglutinin